MKPQPSVDDIAWALRHGAPVVVQVAGPSMEPSIKLGWRVRIVPRREMPRPGDVVLLRGDELTLHRVVLAFRAGGRARMFHVGDASHIPTCADAEAAIGVGISVEEPSGMLWPSLDRAQPVVKARFRRAWTACATYAALYRAASKLGLDENPLLKSGARLYWRVLS